MEHPKAYKLNVNTIKSLSDVKVILDGLNLITYSNLKDFEVLKKYFTEEINQSQEDSESEVVS
jgi:hypothetical protein